MGNENGNGNQDEDRRGSRKKGALPPLCKAQAVTECVLSVGRDELESKPRSQEDCGERENTLQDGGGFGVWERKCPSVASPASPASPGILCRLVPPQKGGGGR